MRVYWFSIFIIDFIKFGLLIILIYPFLIYKYPETSYTFITIIFFIISSCFVNYLLSYFFDTESSGQKFSLLIIYFAFIIFLMIDIFTNLKEISNFTKFFLSDLFPSSQLALSLLMIIL